MVRHLAGIAEIVEDMDRAVRFYREVLGLAVHYEEGSGYATVHLPGVLHFGIWAREKAAESLYGDPQEAGRIPLGFTVGFEVASVDAQAQAMEARGWPVEQRPQAELWGQVTCRFFSPSGALCEIVETPNARRLAQNVQARPEPRDRSS